jgi:hypothetical protein
MPDTDHQSPPIQGDTTPSPAEPDVPSLPAIAQAFDLLENLIDTYLELAEAGEASRTKAAEAVLAETTAPTAFAEALTLIESLVDPDECQRDHHGGCQAHGYLDLEPGEPCPNQHAKDFVAEHKPKEEAETS